MSVLIFSLLKSVMLARALFVAAELNIAEHLAQRSMSVHEIADQIHCHEPSLKRLMYFLQLNGVFEQCENDYYRLTDFSRTMCAQHPNTIKPLLLHDDETRWNCFGHLGYSITTGKAAFDALYGTDYFSFLKENPMYSVRFDDAMAIISAQEDQVIAKKLSFGSVVADIGGGKGQLINAIAQHNAIDQGILIDLPEVVEHADDLHPCCIKKAGSFFEPISLCADTIILKRILHDWDDAHVMIILKNIVLTMQNDSSLYVIDGILDYSENKELLAAIDLALLTIFRGKERSLAEITQLIANAGLEVVTVIRLDALLCAIECRKILSF